MPLKTVITYGTFDMFHVGHVKLIKRLRKYGDNIIIGVSTDDFNQKKSKKSIIPYEQRMEIIQSIQGVSLAIPEHSWEQKREDIAKYNVDILIMGDDWKGKFDDFKDICDVVYLPRTEGISTTEIKKVLSNFDVNLKDNINSIFSLLESIKKGFE